MPPKCILASRPRTRGYLIGPTGCKVKNPKPEDERAIRQKVTRDVHYNNPYANIDIWVQQGSGDRGQWIEARANYDSGWTINQIGITTDFYRAHFAPKRNTGQVIMEPFNTANSGNYNIALFTTNIQFVYEGNEYNFENVPFTGYSTRNDHFDIIFGAHILRLIENAVGKKIKFKY